jgi:hypothetical protein
MTDERVLRLGLGLAAVLCLSADPWLGAAASGDEPRPEERAATRVYTNEDLERVRPFRAETGALSQPAPVSEPQAARESRRDPPAGRGEEHWRREAAKVRERARALAEQAEALRTRLAEQADDGRRLARRNRTSSSQAAEARLRARITALERKMRQLDDDLADRARRDHALPGWLR